MKVMNNVQVGISVARDSYSGGFPFEYLLEYRFFSVTFNEFSPSLP